MRIKRTALSFARTRQLSLRLTFVVLTIAVFPALARANTCGVALTQLNNYFVQVQQIANWESVQGIPMRCGWDQYCTQMQHQMLSHWYSQQLYFVNDRYARIVTECSGAPSSGGQPIVVPSDVEKLEIDDADELVSITIPDTPEGFSPQ